MIQKDSYAMCRNITQTLHEIDGDRTARYSLRRVMMNLFHVSEATVSRMLSGERPLEPEEIRALAICLTDEWDDQRLSECFTGSRRRLMPHFEVFTNGQIMDDWTKMTEYVGEIIRCYNAGEKQQAIAAYIKARKHFEDMGGEIERLS